MLDGDMLVHDFAELQVGDVIVARTGSSFRRVADDGSIFTWDGYGRDQDHGALVVIAVNPVMISQGERQNPRELSTITGRNGVWIRARTGVTAAKGHDQYPGRCPRCNMRAYVGLFEVDHADKRAAKDCPAR